MSRPSYERQSERFINLAKQIAEAAILAGKDKTEDVLKCPLGDSTVEEVIKSEINGVIKENIRLGRVAILGIPEDGRSCVIGAYTHDATNKLGALVRVLSPDAPIPMEHAGQLAHDIALHIAGFPTPAVAITREEVPADIIAAEKAVYQGQLDADPKNAKKPENIKTKIIEGKLNAFFKERVLFEQHFVKDESRTIADLVATASIKSLGAGIVVDKFIRIAI